jgi:hypothetical protein
MEKQEWVEARIGPLRVDWPDEGPRGDCPDCGGQCAPECGVYPLGCIYGAPTTPTSYWLIAERWEHEKRRLTQNSYNS